MPSGSSGGLGGRSRVAFRCLRKSAISALGPPLALHGTSFMNRAYRSSPLTSLPSLSRGRGGVRGAKPSMSRCLRAAAAMTLRVLPRSRLRLVMPGGDRGAEVAVVWIADGVLDLSGGSH